MGWFSTNKSSYQDRKESSVSIDAHDLESSDPSIKLDHIFQDPALAKKYSDIYESCKYECRFHVDPDFTWTKQEERKVVWKNDWYVTFWAFLMFTALDFDRYNIQQALSDNMLDNLKITSNDYNVANTINLVCFLASELPSQLISKKLGADIWIPTQLVLWSIATMSQASLKNKTGFFITRALIGALQGGFICDVSLWISYFYTSKEFPLRLAIFYIANPLTTVWSSLLAAGVLKIHTSSIPEGWKWLFLIEGAFTTIVGLASFFKMAPSAVQTKTWFRKKGWYTEREEKIVVNRVLRDDPSKGDTNNRQPVSFREVLTCLLDYDMWPIYVVRVFTDITNAPIKNYFTLTLRNFGYSTFETNLLNIPQSIISIITMIVMTYVSEIIDSRALLMTACPIWVLSCLIPIRFWPGAQKDVWGTYALLTIVLGAPKIEPLSISWCSVNSNSVRNRAVSSALVNIFLQISAIVSANIYRKDDAPAYKRGNVDLIGISFGALGACVISRMYFVLRNKFKENKWKELTIEERKEYIDDCPDVANKTLDFRFQY